MKTVPRPETALVLSFLAMLAAPASIQTIVEWRRDRSVQALDVVRQRPTAANLRAFERNLDDASWVGQQLRPWIQYAQFMWLNDGGDKAVVGYDGWLFYRQGCQCLTQRAAAPEDGSVGSPLAAITDFRDQLAARGIHLLIVLAPNKESVYPQMLTTRARSAEVLVSPETRQLLADLANAGVEVVNLGDVYQAFKQDPTQAALGPLYLKQDTHWSPLGSSLAARTVAQRILDLGWASAGTAHYEHVPVPVARLGDLVRMLRVPAIAQSTEPEEVECDRIVSRDTLRPYEDDAHAEILVMGDSFLRIYQQDEPGSAGFIAHLARELKQPLTSLVNDGGASTLVRQELHRRPMLLHKKRVVIWEFVDRDIRFGTEGWQKVPLPPGPPAPRRNLAQPIENADNPQLGS